MTIKRNAKTSIRIHSTNLNHHLYSNNGTWWIHYTAYPNPVTTERIRRSLETGDIETARARRDALFKELFYEEETEVSV